MKSEQSIGIGLANTMNMTVSWDNPFNPQRVDFTELSYQLGEYERKHKLSTVEFFRRYSAGEFGDDEEMMLWAGIYHLFLNSRNDQLLSAH